jgi:hypothetical protein
LAEGQPQQGGASLSLVHVNEASGTGGARAVPVIAFDRFELTSILSVYGRKVGQGEWRDYALDFLRERAVFSVFARNSERPLFTIEKLPKLARKQGQYMVANQQGRILKRGHELEQVLKVLEPRLTLVR